MPYYECPACGLTSYSAAGYSAARLCPNCLAELPEDARQHLAARITRCVKRVLPAQPDAVPAARRVVAALPLPDQVRATLALLASELVTNSVRHARASAVDAITLRVTNAPGLVRLAVTDGGPGFSRGLLEPSDPHTIGGQGFVIVDAMAEDWGVERNESGCTVWCDVAVSQEPPDGLASRADVPAAARV